MSPSSPVIEGPYLRDLLDQAAALRNALGAPLPGELQKFTALLRGGDPPFVLLTGMGSSFHALQPLAIRLADRGIRCAMVETSELVHYWSNLLGPRTVVIAVSQSGRSVETLRLLELNAGRSPIIGVTNYPDSPLGTNSDVVVQIHAGAESTVSCKTYLNTLLMLSQLAEELCQGDAGEWRRAAETVPDAVDRYFSGWRDHVAEVQPCLRGCSQIVLAGRGSSLATVGTGGLIIKEAAHFPAEGMSTAAFRHGPLEMASERLFLLVFRGAARTAGLNERIVADAARAGARTALVTDAGGKGPWSIAPTSDALRPILEILPVEIITLALAALEGREAGAFERATKITAIE